MAAQFQYARLAHQSAAVQAIADVFTDVNFVSPTGAQANPVFVPALAEKILRANITRTRESSHIHAGSVQVAGTATPTLSLDVLMETGTGKTFTFIETIHKLHKDKKLSKFIVLVPSNAIRQGTLKSLQTTASFFSREYSNQKINVFNYSSRTVPGFIHAANTGISVLVATYQAFAGDSKVINKRGIEANLLGRAKSYMEALAEIRPVLIIDEPHRFEGKQTLEYLAKFNPVLTVRFGATFKGDTDALKYRNLIYTLDSLEAFRQRLVKGITVDTVGTGAEMAQVLWFTSVSGSAKERTAHVSFQTMAGKNAIVELLAKDNLGDKTGIAFLDGHVVEAVTASEVRFTNDFSLPLGEATSYGMLADQMQALIIGRSIANHFEREETLFKRGIKSLKVQARSLYLDQFMPVDSQIERDTVDKSKQTSITVFAKLPKINIPTPMGNYNPDFGYALQQGDTAQALYLVVETKGYDNRADIPLKEKWKINSAEHFFKALQDLPELKDQGIQIRYQTKINGESLAQLISSMK